MKKNCDYNTEKMVQAGYESALASKNSMIMLRIRFLCIIIMVLTTALQAQDVSDISGQYPERIWAAGNDTGLYIVWFRQKEQKQEFQILYRNNTEKVFRGFRWYAGRPLSLGADNHKLWAFLNNGVSRSYTLSSGSRTERQMPDDFEAVDCHIKKDVVYVLAKAVSATTFDITQATVDPNESSGTTGEISAAAGDYFIFYKENNKPYQSLTTNPLPIELWSKPKLVFQGEEIHLFGIENHVSLGELHGSQGESKYGVLVHCQWTGDNWSESETALEEKVFDLAALEINHQIRVVAYIGTEVLLAKSRTDQKSVETQFVLVWPSDNDWRVSSPLRNGKQGAVIAALNEIAFTSYDEQNLAVIKRHSPEEIFMGIYDINGERIEALGPAVSTISNEKHSWVIWVNLGVLLVVSLIILYWRRAEAFTEAVDLPKYVQLAPVSYRALALFLDILPALLISMVLFPEMRPDPASQVSLWDPMQNAMNSVDPMTAIIFEMTFLCLVTAYMTVCESLLATTPGKMALRLVVLDRSGTAMTPKQAIIRNCLRVIELQVIFMAFLLIFTLRRQRLGDLAARTIVALQNPELVERLNRPPEAKEDEDDNKEK
ncbi:MAG: RDD family protein [Planctomycetes bacterium]|nr:RDD family protein [Planctomycetota bacterium]